MRDNGFVGVSNIVNEWLENRFSISNAGARMHGCRCHHFAILHIAPHFSFVMKGDFLLLALLWRKYLSFFYVRLRVGNSRGAREHTTQGPLGILQLSLGIDSATLQRRNRKLQLQQTSSFHPLTPSSDYVPLLHLIGNSRIRKHPENVWNG